MGDICIRLAKEIATMYLQEEVISVYPIVGKGYVNKIVVVRTNASEVVIRMNNDKRALKDYEKERWCIEQATKKAIYSTNILKMGKHEDVAYMIQTFVHGDNGEDRPNEKKDIWRELGRYARLIHSIQVTGFGEILSEPVHGTFQSPKHENFDGTWYSFVRYNIDCLTENDELIKLDVLSKHQSQKVKQLFESLMLHDFKFGLNHGDISLKNTVVNGNGAVCLLDWGSAEVNIVPHFDIIQMLQCQIEKDNPNDNDINAFVDGYGISPRDFQDMQADLNSLLLLRAFDKLRWAIDRKPELMSQYSEYAKGILMRCLIENDK